MMHSRFIKISDDGNIFASGAWTSVNANLLDVTLQDFQLKQEDKCEVYIDISNVEKFDTFGAWLLERLKRHLVNKGTSVNVIGVDKANKSLFNQIALVNLTANKDDTFVTKLNDSAFAIYGLKASKLWYGFLSFLQMLGAVISAFVKLLRDPFQFRLTSTIHQFDRVVWQALPIVLLVTFIIGAIIAQQGYFHFRQFGAELYVVDMVGFLIMREIGVLLVAIVVAGRSGSAFTAELGSMKMREEIDALKTMGFNPIDVLILPRVLVLVIGLPVLTFIGSLTALFGAGLVSVFYGGITPELYIDRLKDIITITHFNVGMIKAPFIGAVIGIIACTEGFAVKGSASSLGKHTTQSVVKSIFMVIFLDGLFALFFSAIRM